MSEAGATQSKPKAKKKKNETKTPDRKPKRTLAEALAMGVDLTIDETCAVLNLCRRSLYNLQERGEGPRPYKIGSSVRFTQAEIAEFRARMQAKSSANAA